MSTANMESMEAYEKRVVRNGIITVSCAIIANFIPGLYLWLAHGVYLNFELMFQIWLLAFLAFGVSWVVQPVSYFTSLGVSGSYITWIAGSAADLRLPAANMAKKVAEVEDGTPQGDIMSTIGVTCSVFVSVTIVTIFMFIGAQVLPMMPEAVIKSFTYILPAVFGAVYMDLAMKNVKMGISAMIVGILVILFVRATPIPNATAVLWVVISGILVARVWFVLGQKKEK